MVAIPAFLTVLLMVLTFSIATGLACGFLTYVVLSLLSGRGAKVHGFLYVLSLLFASFLALQ